MRKKLFISIILIFALTQISAAQTQEVKPPIDENTPKEVKEYYRLILKWKDMDITKAIDQIKNLSEKELKYIVPLVYKTIEYNYEEFNKYLRIEHKKLMDERFKDKKKVGASFHTLHSIVKEQIKQKIPTKSYALVYIPYFLIIKVAEVNKLQEYEHVVLLEVKGIIKQTLKGHFSENEQISFRYNKLWPNAPTFSIGEEALVLLETRGFGTTDDYGLGLIVYLDKNDGRYFVSNNIVFDPHNFFEYGKEVLIKEFVNSFQNDVKAIKNQE